jgi:hypothetical protein
MNGSRPRHAPANHLKPVNTRPKGDVQFVPTTVRSRLPVFWDDTDFHWKLVLPSAAAYGVVIDGALVTVLEMTCFGG